MAEYHHTSEPGSAKVKYPIYRQLTVQETICGTAAKSRGIGINYVPVKLEPCIVLRGKWLKLAGFPIGEKTSITVNQGEIVITPKQSEVTVDTNRATEG
ncbi:SymE family type I addiction module toxin [Thalassomonas actiniarum]|uniref:Type I addiction module toxin, SymE family n=1 Tax=Thalassomonas actiniarum TaxID=485447 RepID=A0AAE9YL83_9GAMM|nr:SymE family type I addiction module toxin [Thalassomonas actiniarum]WDD96778.1 type I addiction module toxin, SymE family [Thalassomonas actiniarum]